MRISRSAGLVAAFVILCANIGQSFADAAVHDASQRWNARVLNRAQVVYVSDRTLNKVLVYLESQTNAIGAITRGIVEAEGVAVDRNGDLFVANGNGGNVLEYAAGGRGPIRTYTAGLRHPVNVTLDSRGNIYVAEQSPSSIVEYVAGSSSNPRIYPLPFPNDPVRGVAVDSAGDILVSISGIGDAFPLSGSCLAVTKFFVIPFGTTTPLPKYLSSNEQTFGLAVDAGGTMYASDPCLNVLAAYSLPTFKFQGYVRTVGAFNQPFYITIANGYLSVPSAGQGMRGYVTIATMSAQAAYYYTISSGLQGPGPISAVVGTLPRK